MPLSTRARFTAPPTVPYSPRDSFSNSGDEEDVMFRTSYDAPRSGASSPNVEPSQDASEGPAEREQAPRLFPSLNDVARSSSGSPLPTDGANRVGTTSSTRSGSKIPSPTDAANHVQSRVHALMPYASIVHEAGATDFARSGSGSPLESEFSGESAQDDQMDWQPEGKGNKGTRSTRKNQRPEQKRKISTTLQAEPVLGGKRLDLLKIYKVVVAAGGFEQVTKNRGWKQVGDIFRFPSTCTNSAYIIKGLYIRNLLGWEEENVWGNEWVPPKELFGPTAHKSSTLAGKSYKRMQRQICSEVSLDDGVQHQTAGYQDMAATESALTTTLTSPGAAAFLPQAGSDSPESESLTYQEARSQTCQPECSNLRPDHVEVNSFDENARQKVLFALQFGDDDKIEGALNHVITISFERPEQVQLTLTPILLDFVLALARPFLETQIARDTMNHVTDTLDEMMNVKSDGYFDTPNSLERVLKILHIVRNLSLLEDNIPVLARSSRLKELLTKVLDASSNYFEMSRHCIDVLENIARRTELVSSADDYIVILSRQIYAQDRYLVVGTIRSMTAFGLIDSNLPHLMAGLGAEVTNQVTQFLLSDDEELIGTALEYLYLRSVFSEDCRSHLLQAHSGMYIRLLISLSTFRSKFFCPRFIKEYQTVQETQTPSPSASAIQSSNIQPQVPNLNAYYQLDEPYRIKDKFEITDISSNLSLDDMYLLYESRFRLEKALKLKEFYTVLKIAFHKTMNSQTEAFTTVPVVEGLLVRGIQIKMNILQDDKPTLQKEDYTGENHAADELDCLWVPSDDQFDTRCDPSLQPHKYIQKEEQNNNTVFDTVAQTTTTNKDSIDLKGVAFVAMKLLQQISEKP
ncbi:hypothetical protein DFQ28_000379, partial [Apophysomyces sp. BC1034]